MIAYVRDICPSCGNLRVNCSDPERLWYPQRSVCYASASHELTMRRLEKKYEKKRPGTEGLHPMDGVEVWMSTEDLTPDDNFV